MRDGASGWVAVQVVHGGREEVSERHELVGFPLPHLPVLTPWLYSEKTKGCFDTGEATTTGSG